ncbi:hypothetical protein E1295_20000 [Nonomuraea mesophila]|uniref:Uncharacterized protein n=1 Tax=Nonomuraea mesophila TaxID=2530382 RepID=A0A4V2ZA44_9ACTN|nr:hypothetical protein [Nonomuraea mesophila]TDE49932.1 hypothetical protein E1295_20000 [Nonomuraea mesophila]
MPEEAGRGSLPDKLVEQYAETLRALCLDTFAYTLTIAESGRLTSAEAISRLRAAPPWQSAYPPGPYATEGDDDLTLIAIGNGIVTLDGINPDPHRKELTDRLAGPGLRHWYLAQDIEGNSTLYVRHGDAEGEVQCPEPLADEFTPWTKFLGPLTPYTALLASLYDDMELDATAMFLAIIEHESGVRFDRALLDKPSLNVPADPQRPVE